MAIGTEFAVQAGLELKSLLWRRLPGILLWRDDASAGSR